jgi:tetratricopeptide (TPR) repeat protein
MRTQTDKPVIHLFITTFLLLSGCIVNQPVASKPTVEIVEEETIPEINSRALDHFMNGEFLLMQRQYARAVLEFQDALQYDPGALDILTSLATAYLHLGKSENAEAVLLEALSSDPFHEDVRILLGQLYLMKNDLAKAEEHYWMLQSTYPEKVEYSYMMADLSLRKGDKPSALEQFKAIYEKDNSDLSALVKVAELAGEMGDLNYAFEAYQILVGQEPRNLGYWQSYSELAVILRKYEQAINGLENVVLLSSNSNPEILSMLAVLCYEKGEYQKADSILTDLYLQGQRDSQLFYYLGLSKLQKEDYQAMEAFSHEFKESYPEEMAAYTNLALSYINQDKPLDAIGILLQARKLFPDDFSVNYLLGSSYSMEKNYLLAKNSLQTALNISPDSRATKHLLATVLNHLEEWETLDELYVELLAENADDGQALNNYGYALAERGIRLEEALDMAKRANELEPDNAAYLDTMGWIYFRMGSLEKSKYYIGRSLELESDSEVVREHMDEVLKELDIEELHNTVKN